MQQLTTPEFKANEAVFPGENWFFYWKSSPSLWEAKLAQFQVQGPILVPIYWALHSEHHGHFDFGQTKPETDLGRLVECAKRQGREIVFLMPCTPAPFLSNGGMPSYLARNLSLNKDGLAMATIDNSDCINRVYSFYGPEVFQAFRKFAWNLGQYLSQMGICAPICGLNCMRFEGGHIVSYFKDHSPVFNTGFNRYIKQLQDSEPEKVKRLIDDPELENSLKLEYSELIQALYVDSLKEFLSGSWVGVVKTCLLGGSTKDLFRRSKDLWESEKEYFEPLMKSVVSEIYPCTVLLNEKLKKGPLGKIFGDLINNSLLRVQLDDDYYEDESSLSFSPLVFFQLNDGGDGVFDFEKVMSDSGLDYYFSNEFPWTYKIKNDFEPIVEDMDSRVISFFFGHRLNESNFSKLLQLFMNGHKIFLDVDGLSEKLEKRFELFCTENDLKIEKINYISPILKTSLGEGLIITYDGRKLRETSLSKRSRFWETMIHFLDMKHLKIQSEEGLYYFWKTRSSNTYELNYEEVRRVCFYNPTSYKKKAHIISSSNFAFIKVLDQTNTQVKSTPIGIDLKLLPGASVSLDFGYFE